MPHFPVHIRGVHKQNTHLRMPLGCAVHHIAYTVQPRGHIGMGQVFTFACGGVVEYCAGQNAIPDPKIGQTEPTKRHQISGSLIFHDLLPPATKLGQGNIFRSVCPHSVHRVGMHGCSGGACMVAWGVHGCSGACVVAPRGEHAWLLPGGMHGCSKGGHAWLFWGACVVALGGMHGCSRGVCMVALGGHAWLLWGGMGYDEIRRYGQWVGGTHPPGMHSC